MSAPSSTGGKVARFALNAYAGLALLYLFIPILWIVVFSFNQPKGPYNTVWQQFTLENWADPFGDEALTNAFVESLKIAAISTVIATILGSLIAIALARYKFRGSGGLNFFLVLPLTTPEIVLGSALATLFLDWDITRGFTTVVIAHIMFQVSFVALTVRARVRGFDWTLEQAAQDLGASPMRTFWKVTFPLILPGILAAALLSFALSLDDFIITLFNAGSLVTFPLYINGAFARQFPPEVNVLATAILIVSVALMVAGTIWGARGRRRSTT
ncbi:MAG TPA: ABC transporter permease [Ilumatobacteraceae bacterium]|nr:ABC transporter permease [Ilumatobacteraceae bacterium]